MVYEINEYSGDGMSSRQYLSHFGIIGMKWGIRRYQNPDGTLTAAGKERYYGKEASDKLAKELHGYRDYVGPKGNGGRYTRLANSVPMKTIAASMRKYWTQSRSLDKQNRKIEKAYYKSKDYEKNMRKAALAQWEREKGSGYWDSFEQVLAFYREADRSEGFSFSYWVNHSGEKEAKEYLKNQKMQSVADKKYATECKRAVQAFLGEHGDETYTVNYRFGNNISSTKRDLADRGVDIVTGIMNTWDTFGSDFNGTVPIEDLMRLVN